MPAMDARALLGVDPQIENVDAAHTNEKLVPGNNQFNPVSKTCKFILGTNEHNYVISFFKTITLM
jgi:hypothetical protein